MRTLPQLVSSLLPLAIAATPSIASACGGFFCNSAEPVTQAAEQILFAQNGEQVEMHVQIRYQGPPVDFGWLLPVPPDVETSVSTEEVFTRLARYYTPRFLLRTEFAPGCEEPPEPDYGWGWADAGAQSSDSSVQMQPGPDGVNVLSREAVGPYDRVILQAEELEPLMTWLEQNEYQVPLGAEDRLEPYLDGSVFVALKLLPGTDTDDIKPLRLTFTAPAPAVPIRPTAVAAQPDMGLMVYVLGQGRAVPRNYLHVEVNEATITWEDGGQNYIDAVSHAVDEANGQAFVTDFAGRHQGRLGSFDLAVDLVALAEVRNVERLFDFRDVLQAPDVRPFVREAITPPEGVTVDDVLSQPWAFDLFEIDCDGAMLAANLENIVLPARESLDALFETHPDVTRLFTTLSPSEMEVDPIFDLNVDLPGVPAERQGVRTIECGDDDLPDYDAAVITTANGTRYRLVNYGNPHAVTRQGGETVRGADEIGAALIQRPFAAGMFEVETDNRAEITARYGMGDPVEQDDPPIGGEVEGPDVEQPEPEGSPADGRGNAMGCACDAGDGGPVGWLLPGLLLVGFAGRRRR